jgi:hypothetical protein
VRSSSPEEWLSTRAYTLDARMKADASGLPPEEGHHPACHRDACRLMLADAVFSIQGFTRLVRHLSPTAKAMQGGKSLDDFQAETFPTRACGVETSDSFVNAILILETIDHLPRQARDKHVGNVEKERDTFPQVRLRCFATQ